MNAGERAQAKAKHATRWRPGSTYEDQVVEGVAVVDRWHVVLYLPTELVRLDPDDVVIHRWPRRTGKTHRIHSATAQHPAQVQDPHPLGDRTAPTTGSEADVAPQAPAQQELF